MSVKANGTDAKAIALHFIEQTTGRATPNIISKTIVQAKSLLNCGYEKNEIISVIDFLLNKGIQMYSLGYVSTCINNILREMEQIKADEDTKRAVEEMKQEMKTMATNNEVKINDESAQRNRNKARSFGIQSRFGEKHSFDMFEGQ